MEYDDYTSPEGRHAETDQLLDDLILVSNRQPYRHEYDDDGTVSIDRPAGGLTTNAVVDYHRWAFAAAVIALFGAAIWNARSTVER